LKAVGAVVVGASAGAIEALSVVLPPLSSEFPLPIFVVVHIPPDRESIIASLFAAKCQMRVKEAEPSEEIQGGTIYFAAPDYHLLVERNGRLSFSSEEPVLFSRPSIDVLFESAADAYGDALLAIVLTGANADGAAGARAVGSEGGKVVVQAPDTALERTMPEAALREWPSATPLTLTEISEYLQQVVAVNRK
jgi:two-component system chemotaxis response regulator CheB